MQISIKYVIYQLHPIEDSRESLVLSKVEFKGLTYNSFDTEQDAISALIEDNMNYDDYFILKRIFLH